MPPTEKYIAYPLILLLVHHDAAGVVVLVVYELELVPRAEGHDQVFPSPSPARSLGAAIVIGYISFSREKCLTNEIADGSESILIIHDNRSARSADSYFNLQYLLLNWLNSSTNVIRGASGHICQ